MLDEESRDLTTFLEGFNLYRFKRLPFGLSCSASIFVRQLQGALAPLLRNNWIKSYLDDIIIGAPSFQILLQYLDQVFEQMHAAEIKTNLFKCNIGQREVKFLGHIVNEDGYKPDPSKVEAVSKMEPPTNAKGVKGFLGMVGIYCKHIENFSKIASPVTDLTHKNKAYEWTVTCQKAFTTLRDKLTSAPILAKANLKRTFILETDTSQHHVAAVLMQYHEDNLPKVIVYFSKKLRPAEIRYSTTDREVLTIVLAGNVTVISGNPICYPNRPSAYSFSVQTSNQIPQDE